MERVRQEARSGRDIPLDSVGAVTLHMTEGAVRGLIREAGDSVPGAVVISCSLDGDVQAVGTPVRVEVTISALRGEYVPVMADEVREAVALALLRQTELVVEAVDIVVGDVHLLEAGGLVSPRVDPVATRALAEELDTVVAAVPGVLRVQPRLGIGRFARRVVEGLAAIRPGGAEASPGPSGPEPRVSLNVSDAETLVELDVVVAHDHSGPVVVRAVAAAILERLVLTGLPEPRVDVRIVSVG